jgi:hypothetical protein
VGSEGKVQCIRAYMARFWENWDVCNFLHSSPLSMSKYPSFRYSKGLRTFPGFIFQRQSEWIPEHLSVLWLWCAPGHLECYIIFCLGVLTTAGLSHEWGPPFSKDSSGQPVSLIKLFFNLTQLFTWSFPAIFECQMNSRKITITIPPPKCITSYYTFRPSPYQMFL